VVEITRAGEEQTGKIGDINKSIAAMGGMADQNAALAEQTMAAVRSQGQQVGELHRLVRFFRTERERSEAA
jgi:methyl-accepting chemotaxis protein